MTWQKWSVVPVWFLSLVGVIIIGAAASADMRVTWLAITLAGAVVLTFVIQIAIQRKERFVARATASIVGALAVVAVATAVFAII
ncbi:hypothetical protein [Salinibacterium sp. M195]|uniref:hypothetical protein n=1 Tax=Salinibacterium sp. M195 TaxID=2583374 RepID=UPI001C638CDD|nr:hypothetical protein [Salinibacterium sp. M195]QYH35499.1 hypothetical protein FFT87_05765 [Salinibacterium sp. M195]